MPLLEDLRALRTAARYPVGRIGRFALDRTARASAGVLPRPVLDRVLRRPRDAHLDVALLGAWGAAPHLDLLCPPWAPTEHGDPQQGVFRLVGVERSYSSTPPFDGPGVSPLWDEQLTWLHSTWALIGHSQGTAVRSWLAGWLERFLRGTRPGQVALHPFPAATRILNGARTLALLRAAGFGADPAAHAVERLLWRDGAWLRWRLEHHNAANHLLREQVALLLWAEVFSLTGLAGRCRQGLTRSLSRQFGPLGGHLEQSAGYQAQVLGDLLSLEGALGADRPRPDRLRDTIERGIALLRWLALDDGLVALGDGDARPALAPAALFAAAEALGLPATTPSGELRCPGFGLLGLQSAGSRLLLRAGEVPALTSAHVHADQLSICWSQDGERVIDGRGTAAYSGPSRDATRSASWHSTADVPGRTTARFAGPFRLAAHGRGEQLPSEPGSLCARSWDTEGRPLHQRVARAEPDSLVVEDRLLGEGASSGRIFFHFPDAAECRSLGEDKLEVIASAGRFEVRADGASVSASASSWYPKIGVKARARTVIVRPRMVGAAQVARTTIRRLH